MGWPKDLEDKIVETAMWWAGETAKWGLSGEKLRKFFIDTGAVRADVPPRPFEDAMNPATSYKTKGQPVLGPRPMSWCGIFATVVYKEAGLSDAHWKQRPSSKNLRLVAGSRGIGRGDLGIINGKRAKIRETVKVDLSKVLGGAAGTVKVPWEREIWTNHHFIVVEDLGDSVKTVEGNMGLHPVIRENAQEKKIIVCYFTYKPDMPPKQ